MNRFKVYYSREELQWVVWDLLERDVKWFDTITQARDFMDVRENVK
ncbi:MAG: hypothetical protein V3R57_09670 [Candidatus Bathyarchaeia archaeon]